MLRQVLGALSALVVGGCSPGFAATGRFRAVWQAARFRVQSK